MKIMKQLLKSGLETGTCSAIFTGTLKTLLDNVGSWEVDLTLNGELGNCSVTDGGETWDTHFHVEVVDYWHQSLAPKRLEHTPRSCQGVMLLTARLTFSQGEDEYQGVMLIHATTKSSSMTDAVWRFEVQTEKHLNRGDFKGGFPRHITIDGTDHLSPSHVSGLRGYCTWGTKFTRADGSQSDDRGYWYSEETFGDFLDRLPTTPSHIENELKYKLRPQWFEHPPKHYCVDDVEPLSPEMVAKLGRKHKAFLDRFEDVFSRHKSLEDFMTELKEKAV